MLAKLISTAEGIGDRVVDMLLGSAEVGACVPEIGQWCACTLNCNCGAPCSHCACYKYKTYDCLGSCSIVQDPCNDCNL